MLLFPGGKLGPYELLLPLGRGGMGEVWKARDSRLDRTVAIKVSKAAFSDRFQREARAIAALNHPNIATLFDVGPEYLVMEYVEGAPVKPTGDMRKLLDLAAQIADGLAAAHSAGFVHRDLKPDNILATKAGRVKILDFGLAKQTVAPAQDEATLTVTEPGTVMGTIVYMSPEQARGDEIDARSDQFSFGLILYELATGRRAFERATAAETMAAIIRDDAPALPATVPFPVRWIIERLLSKEPEDRYASSKDLVSDLRNARGRLSEAAAVLAAPPAPRTSRSARVLQPAAFALAGAIAALSAALWLRPAWLAPEPAGAALPQVTRFSLEADDPYYPMMAPNGRHVAYLAGPNRTLYIRDFDRDEARQIDGIASPRTRPFWSPDSKFLAFNQGSQLMKIPVTGSAAISIATMPSSTFYTGTWSPDGEIIVFGAGEASNLYQVPARGGLPKLVLESGKRDVPTSARDPSFLPLPGRRVILFCAGFIRTFILDIDSGQLRELGLDGQFPMYTPSGFVIYQRRATPALWAAAFSLNTLRTTGEPFPVYDSSFVSSVSETDTLALIEPGQPAERQLTLRDRSGRAVGVAGTPQKNVDMPAVSPDGNRIAASSSQDRQSSDIWIHDVHRPVRTRLTRGERFVLDPVWSPRGDKILFSAVRNDMGIFSLWIKPADGSSPEVEVLSGARSLRPSDWTGDTILFRTQFAFIRERLSHFQQSDPKSAVIAQEDSAFTWTEKDGRLSPDGRFLIYSSTESGAAEIYVRRFPDGTGKHQISTAGGTRPRWRRDGREIFYRAGSAIMAVPITLEPKLKLGVPAELFRMPLGVEFDAFPDGQRFVTTDALGDVQPATLRIIQNWSAEFRGRADRGK